MSTHPLITTIKNNIGIITLNYPEKNNALNAEIRDELIDVFIAFENNTTVNIIIVNGNGKNFCAGADLTHMLAMTTVSEDENLKDAKQFASLFYQIYSCKKPVITCAHGKTIGGGLGLLSASDIVIAESSTQFCFSEVTLGLVPATIAPFVMQRIGFQYAKYMMLTAELFDTQKALNMRLIDRVCENQTSLDTALTLATHMIKQDQIAMQSTKKWLQNLYPISMAQLDNAARILAAARCSETTKQRLLNYSAMR